MKARMKAISKVAAPGGRKGSERVEAMETMEGYWATRRLRVALAMVEVTDWK
jgi:hypothetical protein